MPRACSVSCRPVAQNMPLPGLSIDDLAGVRRQRRNDLGARLAGDQHAAHRPGVADAQARRCRAARLAGGQSERSALVRLARVHDRPAARAPGGEQRGDRRDRRRAAGVTSLPSEAPKPPGSTKSRCMSMTTSAVAARRRTRRRRASRRCGSVVMRPRVASCAPARRGPGAPWCDSPPMCAPIVRAVGAARPASRRRCGLRSSPRCGRRARAARRGPR